MERSAQKSTILQFRYSNSPFVLINQNIELSELKATTSFNNKLWCLINLRILNGNHSLHFNASIISFKQVKCCQMQVILPHLGKRKTQITFR